MTFNISKQKHVVLKVLFCYLQLCKVISSSLVKINDCGGRSWKVLSVAVFLGSHEGNSQVWKDLYLSTR